MAIDSSLWMIDIPAGTYSVGDRIELKIKAGPANVRSGRGTAILKSIIVGEFGNDNSTFWRIHIKNSNWIDDVSSIAGDALQATSFSDMSGNVQKGHDNELLPNSGWEVTAECIKGATSNVNASLFALIDIDYPSVSSVTDPLTVQGIPTSIVADRTVSVNAFGTSSGANWDVDNVDYFKAGYAYCLSNIELIAINLKTTLMFVAMSNAAGMGGLTRIVPINSLYHGIRKRISYSSKLFKGPMDVKIMAFQDTAGSNITFPMVHDYVKKAA